MTVNDDLETTMEEENFAELLEKSLSERGKRLEPGCKITGRVLKISGEYLFIDIGHKGEGVVDLKEFTDEDGNVTVHEGDEISVYFLSSRRGEMRFTSRLAAGAADAALLEEARRTGIPVEGVVEKEIKGGFEVKFSGGIRAFCPHSQMWLRRIDTTDSIIGTHLSFRIIDYRDGGRSVVVSHRALLEEERKKLKEQTLSELKEGMTVSGTVTALKNFGAFVDIGGVDGLVPVSEIRRGRIKDVHDVLAEGDRVQVMVKTVDRERDRITLSIKDTLADPWERIDQDFSVGSFITGTVAQLAPFGAFVTLSDGIDGLIHISRLGGGKKIQHPREVLAEGDTVEVKVENIDREKRRLSLSLAGAARDAEEEKVSFEKFRSNGTGDSLSGMGTLGDLMSRGAKKKG